MYVVYGSAVQIANEVGWADRPVGRRSVQSEVLGHELTFDDERTGGTS